MPKEAKMEKEVYDLVLKFFKQRYEENLSNRITHKKTDPKKYPTIESIVQLVLEMNKHYQDRDDIGTDKENRFRQVLISKGTIRKAIRKLRDENKISVTDGSYEYVPQMDESLDMHPILDIAEKVKITMGVPSDMIVLSVDPEYTASIAKYLSAIFYKKDIIFIPIGAQILCVGVFPKSVLDGSYDKKSTQSFGIKERVELALHKFNIDYPKFTYGDNYDLEYHMTHNQELVEAYAERARQTEKELAYLYESGSNTPHMFRSFQLGLRMKAEYLERMENAQKEIDEDNMGAFLGIPTEKEWDFMDNPINDIVDDDEKLK